MQKKTINLTVPEQLVGAFEEACARYGHGKQKGMVLSAAILMFLEADGQQQSTFVKRIAVSQVDGRLALRPGVDPGGHEALEAGGQGQDAALLRPRIAARRARATQPSALRNLPALPRVDDGDMAR